VYTVLPWVATHSAQLMLLDLRLDFRVLPSNGLHYHHPLTEAVPLLHTLVLVNSSTLFDTTGRSIVPGLFTPWFANYAPRLKNVAVINALLPGSRCGWLDTVKHLTWGIERLWNSRSFLDVNDRDTGFFTAESERIMLSLPNLASVRLLGRFNRFVTIPLPPHIVFYLAACRVTIDIADANNIGTRIEDWLQPGLVEIF